MANMNCNALAIVLLSLSISIIIPRCAYFAINLEVKGRHTRGALVRGTSPCN